MEFKLLEVNCIERNNQTKNQSKTTMASLRERLKRQIYGKFEAVFVFSFENNYLEPDIVLILFLYLPKSDGH